ncbi:MAG: hypothetical protein ACLFP8_06235 [Alphaproteobacteria bacterium]
MSSYGRSKAFAAIIITLFTIITLRVIATILIPDAPPQKAQTENNNHQGGQKPENVIGQLSAET